MNSRWVDRGRRACGKQRLGTSNPGNGGAILIYTTTMPRSHREPIRVIHPHASLWEALEDDPTFVLRSMFGTKAAYVGGNLVLCFSAKAEPWRGVLVCTERIHHPALLQQFPNISPHPILPKWLYLPEADASFERTAEQLVRLVRRRDPRIGVAPQPKRTSKKRAQVGPGHQGPDKDMRRT